MARRSWDAESCLIAIGALCVLIAVSVPLSCKGVKAAGGINIKYSDGSRSGVVQKISKKGLIWSTWEGELNLGYNQSRSNGEGQSTIVPAIFHFSVSSDEVAKQVQVAERSGARVTLEYQQYLVRGYKYGETGYDVTGVVTNE
jgi:hypothetical protein